MSTRNFKPVSFVNKWYLGEALYEVAGVSMKHVSLISATDAETAMRALDGISRDLPNMGVAKPRKGKWFYSDLGLEVTPLTVTQVTDEMANELRLKNLL